jgi:hypothetical protein
LAKFNAFKVYYSPQKYIDKLDESLLDDGVLDEDEMTEAIEENKELLEEMLSSWTEQDRNKALLPLYGAAYKQSDIHRPNRYNKFTSEGFEGSRGGFSTVGYDPLLPKEEAIAHVAGHLKDLHSLGGTPYAMKIKDPVDLSEHPELDHQRHWNEEFVSPEVNPVRKLDLPKVDIAALLPKVPDVDKFDITSSYDEKTAKLDAIDKIITDWIKTPEAMKVLFKAGLKPPALKDLRDSVGNSETRTFPSNMKYLIEKLLSYQVFDTEARNFVNSKKRISDEELKDVFLD